MKIKYKFISIYIKKNFLFLLKIIIIYLNSNSILKLNYFKYF